MVWHTALISVIIQRRLSNREGCDGRRSAILKADVVLLAATAEPHHNGGDDNRSLGITSAISPWSLLPWAITLAVIIGLARHLFESPIARALTLGLLQALYVFIGAAAGGINPGLCLIDGFFFFAMFGGRGMIDIRDSPQDEATRVQTLPRRYGIKRTTRFTAVCLVISYLFSLAAYFTGDFNDIYLYLVIVFVAIGLVCVWLFATRPSPRLAYILTIIFMMAMGTIICLAMVLGSI